MARVLFEKVNKTFGHHEVIPSFDLEIADHEFMVLVGPSGCGKSTLLRMLAGLEETTGGRIFIGDREVGALPPKDRDLAMVFQNYALYPHMDVRRNLAFGLKMRGYAKDEINRRVAEAAKILELDELLARKPAQLSGGQRQRVAMGRAIVRQPKVFLFDEPLSNLDAKLRVQMRLEIRRLHQRLSTTMIYVTHDQVEAMTLADRIAVINQGRLQQAAPPHEIYEKPVNQFVAGFIGSPAMNFVPARLVDEMGQRLIRASTFKLPAPASMRQPTAVEVIIGLRPEHLCVKAHFRPDEVKIQGTIELIEPLGASMILYTRSGDNLLGMIMEPDTTAKLYDSIDLYIDGRRMHLFDGRTGENLTL